MRYLSCLLALYLLLNTAEGQDTAKKNLLIYRAAATKLSDLIHTKLEIKLDYDKSWLYGKAWITLKQHFYSSDSLLLDAKGMEIHQVSLVKNNHLTDLHYTYNGMVLDISLDRSYASNESYTVFIDYTSKPNDLKTAGGKAITDTKGLYFVNPKGVEKYKATQVWTLGESESSSVWFPTIDKPNQKSTEEIILTFPSKYLSLSNGKLISSKENGNGTRTDDWKMDLPHAPYLFFFGVGDYAVVKDHYKDKEVNYYVERDYEPLARRIFGYTPEMIACYSKILGVEFPWNKYAQMTAEDYVTGAEENTTATMHNAYTQQDARELTEGNRREGTIAHELFHQWFGDYVTAESWSNITLNESFARFGEIIWSDYKYGKEKGEVVAYNHMSRYLSDSSAAKLDLVRYHYENRDDVFDFVSYEKGSMILNMLRNYVGDSAFYKSLNLYLTTNKFKSAEAQQLRLAFETVTGQDLNWFWNQWYYGSGHPKFVIDYVYDDLAGKATVFIRQEQHTGKIFKIPLTIDVYEGEVRTRYPVWIQNAIDTFTFSYKKRPSLINVDGDKIVLCEKEDHKTTDNFIFQYQHAGLYRDRLEAIAYCTKKMTEPEERKLLIQALCDHSSDIKIETLDAFSEEKASSLLFLEPTLVSLATNDSNKTVKSMAIYYLAGFANEKYKPLFLKAAFDSSYLVAARSLQAIAVLDSAKALELSRKMIKEPSKVILARTLQSIIEKYGDESDAVSLYDNFEKSDQYQKPRMYPDYIKYFRKVKSDTQAKVMIDQIIYFRDTNKRAIPETTAIINKALKELADQKTSSGLKDQADYIKERIN